MDVIFGILVPFIGTTFGALLVFFIKNNINNKYEKFMLGFASGVMIAASIWSLLLPAIESSKSIKWLSPSIGFTSGILFLLLINKIANYYKNNKKGNMLILAVTIHNIPEGMAVGLVFSGYLSGNSSITFAGAFALALGIAIQNFPEGSIISLPLHAKGINKLKSFLYGSLSGIVEPIFALLAILLTGYILPLMPFFLSFAAGCMIYVVIEELIPESQNDLKTSSPIMGFSLGFVIMMILDITLG